MSPTQPATSPLWLSCLCVMRCRSMHSTWSSAMPSVPSVSQQIIHLSTTALFISFYIAGFRFSSWFYQKYPFFRHFTLPLFDTCRAHSAINQWHNQRATGCFCLGQVSLTITKTSLSYQASSQKLSNCSPFYIFSFTLFFPHLRFVCIDCHHSHSLYLPLYSSCHHSLFSITCFCSTCWFSFLSVTVCVCFGDLKTCSMSSSLLFPCIHQYPWVPSVWLAGPAGGHQSDCPVSDWQQHDAVDSALHPSGWLHPHRWPGGPGAYLGRGMRVSRRGKRRGDGIFTNKQTGYK